MPSSWLLRSLLFVPGNRPRMLAKGPTTGADALIFDLEDSVPLAEKAAARAMVREAVDGAAYVKPVIIVRVNALSTGLTRPDLEAVLTSRVAGVLLPKCEVAEDVVALDDLLSELERGRGLPAGKIEIHAAVETAKGVLRAETVALASPRVASLSLGGEDFVTHMGVRRTREGEEMRQARSWLALCARAAEVQAIDAIYADFADEEGLRNEARLVRQMGFTGKTLIHPDQVGPVNQIFSPSEDEVAQARRIVAVFEQSMARGEGSVALDGKMVDIPVYKRAQAVVALAEQMK